MRAPIAVLMLFSLAACRDGTLTWERMVTQERVDLYSETKAFPDGRSMRLPPPGAVPRAELAPETPGGEARTLAEGRRQFGIHCAPCHGAAGDGRSYIARFMTLKPPASLVAPPISAYPPDRVLDRISHGFGYMRSYQEIPVADRLAIVQYVRWLQAPGGSQEGALP